MFSKTAKFLSFVILISDLGHDNRNINVSAFVTPSTQSRQIYHQHDTITPKPSSTSSIRKQIRGDDYRNKKTSLKLGYDDQQPKEHFESRSLTPNHILYPLYFPISPVDTASRERVTEKESLEYQNAVEHLSFPMALRQMKISLESIKESKDREQIIQKLGGNLSLIDEELDSHSRVNGDSSKIYTIQIAQSISHPIDTLCWLHANEERIDAMTTVPYSSFTNQQTDKPTIIYLSNAENTFEAASIGSAFKTHDLAHENYWNIIKSLPSGSGIYGGKRFDENGQISEEWKDFGKELWVLPLIELRQERTISATSGQSIDKENERRNNTFDMALLVHFHFDSFDSLMKQVDDAIELLDIVTSDVSPSTPCTTLPPILSRGSNPDAQDVFENGVNEALDRFESLRYPYLQKVVLARRADLRFGAKFSGLDAMKKIKFGGSVGHLFYIHPGGNSKQEFFGCTPERLFQVKGKEKKVISEALAGTRPRGSSSTDDVELLNDLMNSDKDRKENIITGQFIQESFDQLVEQGKVKMVNDSKSIENSGGRFFVRRLRHLQHMCQSFEGILINDSSSVDVTRFLLNGLHPTPAVCGFPAKESIDFIREFEGISFDRGMYAGPFGFIGSDSAEIIVAIRSGLLTKAEIGPPGVGNILPAKLSVYAGAGIVPGSTVQGEWSETGYKLGVLSSIFAQSPLTLKSFATPNEAWANAFVEELIRSGVTQFYICPGSRSTPLTAVLARVMRSHVGIVECISTHDERGAAFRALGYARATKRPAAVVTSSGTAVANLYPAVMEASLDGVPLLLLTADRPYENRDTGANQAVDQIKVFSDSYIRWFRDIAPPNDDVPVSLALSDANHAVMVANELLGPVHLNIQFRENLAPDSGPIRGDDREGVETSFSNSKFTDVAGFKRWSGSGSHWSQTYTSSGQNNEIAMMKLASMISQSTRGIIVVGNLRKDGIEGGSADADSTAAIISDFAEMVGFPIFAGAQSANLRFSSSMVIPYSDHILKSGNVKTKLKPDLIIQIGSHLVSTEIQGLITQSMKSNPSSSHVLIHTPRPSERVDASGTITHQILSDVHEFLPSLQAHMLRGGVYASQTFGSELCPLILMGRNLAKQMPNFIQLASSTITDHNEKVWESNESQSDKCLLTEPQIVLAIAQSLSEINCEETSNLFLSNSMPVRDAEFFLYPLNDDIVQAGKITLKSVAVNRGASGIDGIISTATGFTESSTDPTTLLIGDLATIHDLNSFHNMAQSHLRNPLPLTTIVVNNDGGGIFSFLPIAKHGNDVNFEEFFGTPTNSFSFQDGAKAFGLPYENAMDFNSFKDKYKQSLLLGKPSFLEAFVVGRDLNVKVHAEITKRTNAFISENFISEKSNNPLIAREMELPIRIYNKENKLHKTRKNLVLLHGWMGDKSEWDTVGESLWKTLSNDWNLVSIDLPGHGESPILLSADGEMIDAMLSGTADKKGSSIDVATAILSSLKRDHGIDTVDAIAGYSLGGRVAMHLLSGLAMTTENAAKISDDAQLFLLGSNPGEFDDNGAPQRLIQRKANDSKLSQLIRKLYSTQRADSKWINFLESWYSVNLWGNLKERNKSLFSRMVQKRIVSLKERGADIAYILEICSVGAENKNFWSNLDPNRIHFMAGEYDSKYTTIGQEWRKRRGIQYYEVKGSGHALLTETYEEVANILAGVLTQTYGDPSTMLKNSRVTDRTSKPDLSMSITSETSTSVVPTLLDFEKFQIELTSGSDKGKGVSGIGWGQQGMVSNKVAIREGLVISLSSEDGTFVGLGEVSPLAGVHPETFEEAKRQIEEIGHIFLRKEFQLQPIECENILKFDGSLTIYIDSLMKEMKTKYSLSFDNLGWSVRSGLEMALLSLACHTTQVPFPHAICRNSVESSSVRTLPINGLETRKDQSSVQGTNSNLFDNFPSIKVKVGHSTIEEDISSVVNILSQKSRCARADANRSWNESDAVAFGKALIAQASDKMDKFEFVEEPLQKVQVNDWNLLQQIRSLERWYDATGVGYALDESLAEEALSYGSDYTRMISQIKQVLETARGCVAIVLKPSLLGFERSVLLSRMAHEDLSIGVVYTSTFDSGLGLSMVSFVASASDESANEKLRYPHGISTYSVLGADTLSPPFSSYVSIDGKINLSSLGNALYGLGLDEIRGYTYTSGESKQFEEFEEYDAEEMYHAASSTSDTGREIDIQVSLPLPFSDDIACARFADLPQTPRWSPWLNSVAYLGESETEWTLNVRGVEFRWKAISQMLEYPKGMIWESTSGLKNQGRVEFIKVSDDSCLMRVRMTIITPRIVASVFKTTGEFVKDFVENKLLKWSLESFRDVVKADLALERGDVELGDALFGAVEGRSNAIEATLSYGSFEEKGSRDE